MDHSIFIDNAETRPCYIDATPPEIVSEILLFASEGLNPKDPILKWQFPLLIRRVSTRFFHITNSIPALWRFLYIRGPLRKYLHNHITRSAPLSLFAAIKFGSKIGEMRSARGGAEQGWREMVKVLVPGIPRLERLVITSKRDNSPILELLKHDMPMLESLDIRGRLDHCGSLPAYKLRPSQFPRLHTLLSNGFFHWANGETLPQTIDNIGLYMNPIVDAQPFRHFWTFFPSKLRDLEIGHLTWGAIVPPLEGKLHLPSLTGIWLRECTGPGELSILRYLDAPSLRHLTVHMKRCPRGEMDAVSWGLEFPALDYFEWRSEIQPPRLDNFLRRCDALTVVCFFTPRRCVGTVADFVGVLRSDSEFLPLLESLTVFGPSIYHLKGAVQARPTMKYLALHPVDLDPDCRDSEEGRPECMAWLASHVELEKGEPYQAAYKW